MGDRKRCATLQCTFGNFPRNKYNAFVQYVRLKRHFEQMLPGVLMSDDWSYRYPGTAEQDASGNMIVKNKDSIEHVTPIR